MRIRGTATAFALIVAAGVSGSYYVLTAHHRATAPAVGSQVVSADLLSAQDSQAVVRAADHFYWLNNGPSAGPLYARAEQLFLENGDERDALHAKIGGLRSNAETMSFVDLSHFLNEQLEDPNVQGDKRLRLWRLIAKGYTDIEIDYRATKRDWLEAQGIANEWAKSNGPLGLPANWG